MKPLVALLALVICSQAATLPKQWQLSDSSLLEYFKQETAELSEKCLTEIQTAAQWREAAPKYREQLAEMLSLSPMPARTPLNAKVTKRLEHDMFTVENLHFQSSPRLYVTANLYLPKNLTKPAPTILYVTGHGPVITNGVSYGNKVAYQHHGAWFARNGYACLIIDTLQLGEIRGLHHGTHTEGLWWWNSRGYTPAGIECWNGMRALDYLSTRPEVDTNRFGVTGRSGGGAYSWFITAMDDRIKAAAPVAGITDLENHVVDGAVEGHCDCMFFVNTYRWDYPQLAALAAPRPLLLCNTDSDYIFPLDGVMRTQTKVRRIYDLLGAGTNFGVVITPGPHKDTQDLQVPVMRWFNRYLKHEEPLIETAATKLFTPQQLKVFETLPSNAINSNIHFTFVSQAKIALPKSAIDWATQREELLNRLRTKCFRASADEIASSKAIVDLGTGIPSLSVSDISTLSVTAGDSGAPKRIILRIHYTAKRQQDPRFSDVASRLVDGQLTFTTPVRTFQSAADKRKQAHLLRRYMLLGETLDTRRVADITRAIRSIRASEKFGKLPLRVEAEDDLAVDALYASLFAPVDELILTNLPKSHMQGPDYLNVLRVLDIPQTVALASERARVELRGAQEADWQFASQTARIAGYEKNLVIKN
jgi:dienelactone hydrolase